jgi:hypothetical protein
VTLHQARVAAQKVFAAKLEGRDPASEKRQAKRRLVADRVEDLLETFIAQHLSQNRSGGEISRLLRREEGKPWAGRSIHGITKRDVVELIRAIKQRGAPVAANKALKSVKTLLRWCVGRAVLGQSPAEGVPLPAKEVARDRVLNDKELAMSALPLKADIRVTDRHVCFWPRGDIGPEAVAPWRTAEPYIPGHDPTLRDNHLAATAFDDLGRLWAGRRSRCLRSVRRRRASSGRFALDCGVHFRAE